MNPKRYFELMESGLLVQQDNFWYGTRVTQNIQAFTADGYHTFLYIDPIGRFVERYVLPPAEWMLLGSGAIIKRKWIDSIMDRKGKIPVFMINNRNLSCFAVSSKGKSIAALRQMQVLFQSTSRKTRNMACLSA